jgi:hypothetical protein
MKQKYHIDVINGILQRQTSLHRFTILILCLVFGNAVNAQAITYSFANAEITTSGLDRYYEADIMLSTDTDFKLGSGQFYFDYNTNAFGASISLGNLKFTHPAAPAAGEADYIVDQDYIDLISEYSAVVVADTAPSKLSIAWIQALGSSLITIITAAGSPHKLVHIKIKYVTGQENLDPMILFDDALGNDLTFNASSNSIAGDGAQITDDSFDSSGAVLSYIWVGGSTGSDWDTASNWGYGSVPTATSNAVIATGTTITALGDITVNNLTLDASSALTVAGNINNSGDVLLKAGSSLIAKNSMDFDFTYNRTIATSNWYVISSPTLNQNIDEFVASSDLASGIANNLAFGTYDTATNTWEYYQSGASANSDVFNSATGYIMKLSGGSGDIDFSGTMPTNDSFAITLLTTGNGFNLIGNPYPSFMNSATVLTNSTAAIETQTIWVWDQSANGGAGGYEVKVTIDDFKVAPGQGFFVQADSDGGDVLISEAEQSHEATDTFAKNANTRPEVHLSMTDGSLVSDTKMYYIDGTTTDFDNGYDGPLFTAADNSFAVYTQLVTGNKGIDYDLQSLPSSGYESMIIPVGVNAVSGTEITFSARSINIPDGLSVILENRITGTYTELNQEIDTYTVTLNEDNSGIGQFYIHTNTMSTLSTGGFIFENVSMYKTTARNIRITGLPEGKGSLKMYSILGQEVFRTSFEGARVNDIQLPSSLKSGIFIVKLETETGSFTKKVILE